MQGIKFYQRAAVALLMIYAPGSFCFAETAPRCSPEAQALSSKAEFCYTHSDFSCAKSAVSEALSMAPDCPKALYLQSFLSEREGRTEESQLLRERARQGDPTLGRGRSEKGDNGTLVNVSFEEEHDPFYLEQFNTLLSIARHDVPSAYAAITSLWNLHYPGLLHPLTVQIKEIPSDTLRRWKVAYVQPIGRADNFHQGLVIDIGSYIQYPQANYHQIIMHEMAHVIMGDIEAGPKALRIPSWLNEGYAQSVTLEGKLRVREEMAVMHQSGNTPIPCDLDGPIDEFAHGPFNAQCYSEYYLAVQRLNQVGGSYVLPKILAGLHDGVEISDLIRTVTGMDWPSLKNNIEGYTHDVLTGRQAIP